jgi:hypothetical protein
MLSWFSAVPLNGASDPSARMIFSPVAASRPAWLGVIV